MAPVLRPFLLLPEDVLHEILAHLLVDTPRSPTRAAILRTCSTLHRLGVPLLYQVIDLRGIGTFTNIISAWTCLLGTKGAFTKHGRMPDLARNVRELRIGDGPYRQADFKLGKIELPRCMSFTGPATYIASNSVRGLGSLLHSLPVQELSLVHGSRSSGAGSWDVPLVDTYKPSTCDALFEQAWPDLKILRFYGTLWLDRYGDNALPTEERPLRLAFSGWTFNTLAVEIGRVNERHQSTPAAIKSFRAFFDPVDSVESDTWWPGMSRIELRLPRWMEAEFRRRPREADKLGPLARLQERVFPMIVFIREDGTEWRLMDG